MRLGVLGGTFDPPHNGHLLIAEAARHALELAQVLFIPARQPPHKLNEPITSVEARLAMLERALKSKPYFVISPIEIQRPGPSYTVDTLRQLRRELAPTTQLYFIMGMDSLFNLPTWHQPTEIVKLCKLAVLKRPGYIADLDALEQKVPGIKAAVVFVRAPEAAVSSTEIQARARAGESIREFVPPAVADYIERHHLYKENK